MNTSGTYSQSQLVSAMRKYIDKHYHENFLLNDLTEKIQCEYVSRLKIIYQRDGCITDCLQNAAANRHSTDFTDGYR